MLSLWRRSLLVIAAVAPLAAALPARAQPSAADWGAPAKRPDNVGGKLTLKFGPLRNGDAGGYFLEATLANGQAMTHSVELPE